MPKEIILNARVGFPDEDSREPLVELSWQRDLEYVQIATFARHPESKETIGRDDAQFVTLERHGINKMIRVLRKARDQAFGKDE